MSELPADWEEVAAEDRPAGGPAGEVSHCWLVDRPCLFDMDNPDAWLRSDLTAADLPRVDG